MKNLKQDLQGVIREFNALTKKTKELTTKLKKKAVDQLEKAQAAVTPEAAAQRTAEALKSLTKTMGKIAKAVEKFEMERGAKKARAKTKASAKTRKAPTKKTPVKKKAAKLTATDQVVNIIKRSKKGVDVPTLIKKSGVEDKTIRNILVRASRQGKIKRTGRGIYAGA